MARSDNTSKAEWPRYAYPRGRDFKRHWRRPRVKASRRRVAVAVASGREPEPQDRNARHSALWDAF